MGVEVYCLAEGMSNEEGDVHLAGQMPSQSVVSLAAVTPSPDEPSGKIWLVLSDDVDCSDGTGMMTGWHGAEYLFEYDLISY